MEKGKLEFDPITKEMLNVNMAVALIKILYLENKISESEYKAVLKNARRSFKEIKIAW